MGNSPMPSHPAARFGRSNGIARAAMPAITPELLVTALAVAVGVLAFLHLLAGARASVVLAHQIEYDRQHKPPADHTDKSDAESGDSPSNQPAKTAPIEVG